MEDAVTNKEHIVDMNNGEPLTLDETCILLNELYDKNKEYELLVKSLKDTNQKLKLRLKDLGVEYL